MKNFYILFQKINKKTSENFILLYSNRKLMNMKDPLFFMIIIIFFKHFYEVIIMCVKKLENDCIQFFFL